MMKIKFSDAFLDDLENQYYYISKDKPKAAKKFKSEVIKNLKKDLKFPFRFKKSIYFDDYLYRDYVFKGYTCVYFIDEKANIVTILALIKHQEKL